MYYIYVLQNKQGDFYIDYTSDLKRRLKEHNSGKNTSTKSHSWDLVYYEAYRSEIVAREREKKLKAHGRSKQLLLERVKAQF